MLRHHPMTTLLLVQHKANDSTFIHDMIAKRKAYASGALLPKQPKRIKQSTSSAEPVKSEDRTEEIPGTLEEDANGEFC